MNKKISLVILSFDYDELSLYDFANFEDLSFKEAN